jgi:tartrate-resistant acid phosphatase type 5
MVDTFDTSRYYQTLTKSAIELQTVEVPKKRFLSYFWIAILSTLIALSFVLVLGFLSAGAIFHFLELHGGPKFVQHSEFMSSSLVPNVESLRVRSVSPVYVPPTVSQSAYNFIVFGDWGTGTESQKEVASGMNTIATRSKIDGIISTGDQFYWNGIDNTTDPLIRRYFTDIYYGYDSLKVLPWYLILGNHDWIKNPLAQIEYSKINTKWNLPSKWHTKEFKLDDIEIQYIFMDTSPYSELERSRNPQVRAEDPRPQTAWLTKVLESGKARFKWRFVIGHHTFYSSGTYGDFGSKNMTNIEKLFNEYKIDGYFNGHQHILQHLQTTHMGHSMNYFISGAGGQTVSNHIVVENHPYNKFVVGKTPGFMTMEIKKDEFSVKVHDANGRQLHVYRNVKK